MSGPTSRLKNVLGHLSSAISPSKSPVGYDHSHHIHALSPTFFLERAAAIEPDAPAVFHVTANNKVVRRSYAEFADRARGIAYFLLKRGYKRVGVLSTNTPAHLESIFGIVAARGVIVPVNYRLKPDDVTYIFDFAEVDSIIVDTEFLPLLDDFRRSHPNVPLVIDLDTDATEGPSCGPYNEAILEGLACDKEQGSKGWDGLESHCTNEDDMIAIPFTSGTTSRPKGCVYTHRGAYLASLANVVESGLNYDYGSCRYLWTLPMFHAMGWTFPWSVTAVRGTHYCLRKIDYPLIWKLLKEERITHFNAAPTVNTLLCAAKEAARLPEPVRVTVAASPPTGYLFAQMTKLNLRPVHVYGMTETYGPITKGYPMPHWDTLPSHEKYAKMARQGHGFLTSLPIRVVKPDQRDGVLVDVAKDGKEIGEIIFFGNICAKGYYKDPEATRKLFAGGGLHSGDLAVWHADGSAQIQDRAKDIIISGGENISSVALESMLVQHPDVLEAGVVSVPDEQWGERPKAYLTVKESVRHGSREQLKPSDFIDWAKHRSNGMNENPPCRIPKSLFLDLSPAIFQLSDSKTNMSTISRYMVPREVEIIKELPKTSTGKIQKNVLREWAKKGVPEGMR